MTANAFSLKNKTENFNEINKNMKHLITKLLDEAYKYGFSCSDEEIEDDDTVTNAAINNAVEQSYEYNFAMKLKYLYDKWYKETNAAEDITLKLVTAGYIDKLYIDKNNIDKINSPELIARYDNIKDYRHIVLTLIYNNVNCTNSLSTSDTNLDGTIFKPIHDVVSADSNENVSIPHFIITTADELNAQALVIMPKFAVPRSVNFGTINFQTPYIFKSDGASVYNIFYPDVVHQTFDLCNRSVNQYKLHFEQSAQCLFNLKIDIANFVNSSSTLFSNFKKLSTSSQIELNIYCDNANQASQFCSAGKPAVFTFKHFPLSISKLIISIDITSENDSDMVNTVLLSNALNYLNIVIDKNFPALHVGQIKYPIYYSDIIGLAGWTLDKDWISNTWTCELFIIQDISNRAEEAVFVNYANFNYPEKMLAAYKENLDMALNHMVDGNSQCWTLLHGVDGTANVYRFEGYILDLLDLSEANEHYQGSYTFQLNYEKNKSRSLRKRPNSHKA